MTQDTGRRALLVIGPEPPPWTGMETATQAFVAELRRAGIPFLRVDTADADDVANRGRWTWRNISLACRHVISVGRKSLRPDVKAIYLPIAQAFPALFRDLAFVALARMARKPCVIHLNGGYFHEFYAARSAPVRLLLRKVLGSAAVGIVLTEALRPTLECVLPPERIRVVQNGVDLPGVAAEPGRDGDGITATFLSSLFPSKGVLVFIRALALAREREPALRGVIAGTWRPPETQREAESLIRHLSLEDHLELPGPVEGARKTELLASSDIFCLPSFYPFEGQPFVVIEAMAAGLPVVATAWRGIADTVVDGETGLLVDEPRPELVAEKLAYLAGSPAERRRMGAAGRERYERIYTQRAFGERMIEVVRPFIDTADAGRTR